MAKYRASFVAISLVMVLAFILSACQSAATATPASALSTPTKAIAAATPTPAAAGQSSTTSGKPPACPMLTKDEVQAAIGKPVVTEEEDLPAATTLSSCRYHDPADKSEAFVVLKVSTDWKRQHEAKKTNGGPFEVVSGIGDDAFWQKDLSTLNVLKGQRGISLWVSATDVADPLTAAQTLAPKALARLP